MLSVAVACCPVLGSSATVAVAMACTAPRSCTSSMLSKLEGTSWHPSVDGAAAFVTFTDEMYEAMLHDDARTSAFGLAISRRVRAHAGDCVVLDLGTGPFAVLALFAARAGASKVFAVEANPEAAAKARALIASSAASDIPPGTIEIIEGFSTTITLPEQADLLISEIAGSIASEEGMLATIRDARLRHMKRPWDPRSYIPARVQTLAVPAAYSLHHRLNCTWIASGPPVRFACDNPWLLPLATPQLWEDFAFGGEELPPGSGARCTTVLEFRVCASTLKANAARLLEQLDLHDVDADRAGVPKQGRSQNPAPCPARPAPSNSPIARRAPLIILRWPLIATDCMFASLIRCPRPLTRAARRGRGALSVRARLLATPRAR